MPSRWQKNRATVDACELTAIDTHESCPLICTIFYKFLYLIFRRHHPRFSPFNVSHVIMRTCDVTANVIIMLITTVLKINMLISFKIVIILLLRLSPGVVAAVALWGGGTDIAARPFRAGGKAEVNHVGMMIIRAGEIRLRLLIILWIESAQDVINNNQSICQVDASIIVHIQVVSLRLGGERHE